MSFLLKILVTAVAIYIAAMLVPGASVNNVGTTIVVALVLALLNTFVKPILVILTIPVTLITLGLFLLIINALMIKWAAALVHGFSLSGWWPALLVSIIVTVVSYLFNAIIGQRN